MRSSWRMWYPWPRRAAFNMSRFLDRDTGLRLLSHALPHGQLEPAGPVHPPGWRDTPARPAHGPSSASFPSRCPKQSSRSRQGCTSPLDPGDAVSPALGICHQISGEAPLPTSLLNAHAFGVLYAGGFVCSQNCFPLLLRAPTRLLPWVPRPHLTLQTHQHRTTGKQPLYIVHGGRGKMPGTKNVCARVDMLQ